MRHDSTSKWIFAALLLSLPQLASATDGDGDGTFYGFMLLLLLFVVVGGMLLIWLGRFINQRSQAASRMAVGFSVIAPIGYVLLSSTSSESIPQLVLMALLFMLPLLFVTFLLVAAFVRSMPAREGRGE